VSSTRERPVVPPAEPRSYYGQPVIKPPVWTWEVPMYLFAGGLAGASAALARLAELRGNHVLARRSWAIALAGLSASPALLVSDLGRPERFLHMLRVFKVTSPMNVGSWILAASGAATSVAAADAWTGAFPRSGRPARNAAAALGLPLATYTGALLSSTAVPVWHEARSLLPFSFAGSAAASAGAAAVLTTPARHAAPARRAALFGAALEAVATELSERRLGAAGEPYRRGAAGRFSRTAKACAAAGFGLMAAGGGRRPAHLAGAALLVCGSVSKRWAVFKAGFESARDPRYTVGPQRERLEAGRFGPRAGVGTHGP